MTEHQYTKRLEKDLAQALVRIVQLEQALKEARRQLQALKEELTK